MQRLLDLFSALADPSRLRIFLLLREIELSMGELAQVLNQSQPRISRHVRILAEAGLLRRQKEGAFAFVRRAESEAARAAAALIERLDGERGPAAVDRARLADVRAQRRALLDRWFADHAEEWDLMRSLEAPDAEVEAAILELATARGIGRLLDIGTGTGRMIELLGPAAKAMAGLDRSPEMLRVARSKLEAAGLGAADLRPGDVHDPPFPHESFETVILHQLLHFLDTPEAAIAEAARLLAPGGQLLLVDYLAHDLEELATRFRHARLGFDPADVEAMLKASGLDLRAFRTIAGPRLVIAIWQGVRA
ncbi:ArsR/SmtB family transcription factor [Thermaurantiacus sp.]